MFALACILTTCGNKPAERGGDELVGSELCGTCHEQELRFCRYGAHRTLECEQCHGPGSEHALADAAARPEMSLGGAGLCLSCHAEGAGSPSEVPSRIKSFEDHLANLEREHRVTLDRKQSGSDCVFCHDPHLLE